MTLPSGQISLVDLNNTLNGGAAGPIYLTSFYANGSTKSRGMTGIPLSGQIGLQGFQGKRAIPVVSGLIGKYTGESWNGSTLVDETGSGNNSNASRGGAITTATSTTTGLKYIYGGTSAGLQFPSAILPPTYTLFHLTRYNGGSRGRIMNGNSSNWLSTHHAGSSTRCYHEGYLYDDDFVNSNVLSWCLTSDQNSLYRMNGRTFGTSGGSASTALTINYGYYIETESSDWAVYCFFVYNRTLSLAEIQDMEAYLRAQYQTLIMSVNDWYSLFTRVNSANFTMVQSGVDPFVQLQMNDKGIQSSNTSLWYNKSIQNYSSFVVDFYVYIVDGSAFGGSADGSSFNVGHTGQSFWGEGPNVPAFCIAFHLYAQGKTPGIYLYNNAGTQVGFYQVALGNSTWTRVRIIYTRSTTNTWQIFYNNTSVITYSNPNNESWVTSSAGTNFGFGSRNGGYTHDFYVSQFSLYIQD